MTTLKPYQLKLRTNSKKYRRMNTFLAMFLCFTSAGLIAFVLLAGLEILKIHAQGVL